MAVGEAGGEDFRVRGVGDGFAGTEEDAENEQAHEAADHAGGGGGAGPDEDADAEDDVDELRCEALCR